jgi:3-deoxy-D-manno-octulosonic-acid transferase
MLYASADVAFVGGSMVAVGGHNVLEPAAVGVPVMFGPFMANFKEIAGGIIRHGAAIQCQNKDDVARAVYAIYEDAAYRASLIEKAKVFVRQNRGAKAKLSEMLDQAINQAAQ